MPIVIRLPFPVSLNQLYRANRGRVHKSAKYLAWIKQADALWLTQKRAFKEPITGPFRAVISVTPPDKRRRDIDNFATKAVMDALQRFRVITDDRNAVETTIKMLPPGEAGCEVNLEPLEATACPGA